MQYSLYTHFLYDTKHTISAHSHFHHNFVFISSLKISSHYPQGGVLIPCMKEGVLFQALAYPSIHMGEVLLISNVYIEIGY